MTSTTFKCHASEHGVAIELVQTRRFARDEFVHPHKWATFAPKESLCAISRLLDMTDNDDGSVSIRENMLLVSHPTVASLSDSHSRLLSLPSVIPHVLSISSRGIITNENFTVTSSWRDSAGRPINIDRVGSITISGEGKPEFRIPLPLYLVVSAVDDFTTYADPDKRLSALSKLQDIIFTRDVNNLDVVGGAKKVRVRHVTQFSLAVNTDSDGINFEPVLFEKQAKSNISEVDDQEVDECDSIYSGQLRSTLTRRLREDRNLSYCVPVDGGNYVYLDPPLRTALKVVRAMQSADCETRRAFVMNPRAVLHATINGTLTDDEIEGLFVETSQYSSRIREIGYWRKPILPWIKKESETWLPERFGIFIEGKYIELDREDATALRSEIKDAIKSGALGVSFRGVSIPATNSSLEALDHLIYLAKPVDSSDGSCGAVPPKVLVVYDNFETVEYIADKRTRSDCPPLVLSENQESYLKPHQCTGVKWLHECWLAGYPGVLLADDMGLGKTLQTLIFLSWVRKARANFPVMVVAPKSLIENWLAECRKHRLQPQIGEGLVVFGKKLASLRMRPDRDIIHGSAGLNIDKLNESDWVLTTYETLRDYHFSFGSVEFGCIVFDEIQRAKNPSALITHAAKTLKSEFSIGLTGTPVENRLEDLWSIMDVLSPGYFGDLKQFSQTYSASDQDSVQRLRELLLEPALGKNGNTLPPRVLRRMKRDHLTGLPQKHEHKLISTMPTKQEKAYDAAVISAPEFHILRLLHLLRGISLHPSIRTSDEATPPDEFARDSARVVEMFRILDQVSAKKEKALIFIEDLEMQDLVSIQIQRRYGLKRKPLQINGQVTSLRRQSAVDEFQKERGIFDVLILSPRAGGVGLTLHAANHVIHLSRWWNPAVEDQCTDRVYRIGQVANVHVYIPMARHARIGDLSFDFVLDRLMEKKRELANKLMFLPPVDAQTDMAWFTKCINVGDPVKHQEDSSAGSRAWVSPEYSTTLPNHSKEVITLADIDRMEPLEFERWMIRKFHVNGYISHYTPCSGDAGADGVFWDERSNSKVLVQCKHTANVDSASSSQAVKDLLRARDIYNFPNAVLVAVTNAPAFDDTAMRLAQIHSVILVARGNLLNWPWV